jgi:hypothetical protein
MPHLTPVEVAAEVNGQVAAQLTLKPGREGLFTAQGPGNPQGAAVRLWSRSQNPELRELCAELVGQGAAP